MVRTVTRIVATVVLLSIAMGSLALASQGESRQPVFAAARDGDRWTYTQQDFVDGNATGEPVARLFARLGPDQVLAADGGVVGGSAVAESRVDRSPCGTPVDFRIVTVARPDRSLGHRVEGEVGPAGCAQTTIVTGVVDPNDSIERYEVVDAERVGTDPLPCGHTHPLAGRAAPREMTVAGDCTGPLRLLGWQDGTAVYEDAGGQQVWFRPGTPVPVRIRQPLDEGVRVLELVDFVPGDGPVAWAADEPGPGLAPRPASQGQPDPAGFELAFPLAAALAEAAQDGPFQQILDAGFLMSAAYATQRVEAPEGDEIHRTWALAATDGQRARAIAVRATEKHDDTLSRLPAWSATREARTTIEVTPESWPSSGPFPARPAAAMPAVADALGLWQKLGGQRADAYAFLHACADDACHNVTSTLTVGRVFGVLEMPTFVCVSCNWRTQWDVDTLTVDHTGAVVGTERRAPVAVQQTSLTLPDVREPDPRPAVPAPLAAAAFVPPPVAAGLTVAAVLGAAAYVVYTLTKSGAITLWHRGLDEHPMRQQILRLVHDEPGIHHKELMRRLERGNHVVSHHVRRLVAADLLAQQAGPRFTCYFPKGKVDRRIMAAAPVLKSDVAHRMLQLVAQRPGQSGKELAAALGVVPGNVTFHAKRMQEAGLIETGREGRSLAYRPTALGLQALRVGLAA